jgi:hypothetical protein
MKHLLIGAAAIALAVGPLTAQGNGHGKSQSHGQGNAEHGPTMHGPSMHGPSMQGPSMKGAAKHTDRGNSGHKAGSMASAMEAAAPQHGNGKAHPAGKGAAKANESGDRGRSAMAHAAKPEKQAVPRGNGNARAENAAAKSGVRVLQDGRRYYSERDARDAFDFAAARRGLIDGCPPGLAKKNNGCLPPGLAKQRSYRPDWWGLAGLAGGSYAYDDGYLLRLNSDDVAGYIPLLGGALSPGNIWPSAYASQPVPDYYADYYDLGPPDSYRYADDVLYRIDPSTSAITSIAGLLTGDTFAIGSPLPPGYDVYNVPYPYRSQYPDGPDARYRYSDGYIYQVDPATQLITAAIDLLAG